MANNKKIQITKNQHYVPQLLLRLFSKGQKELVCVYDSANDLYRNNTRTKEVFSQNYFYDHNNFVENFLANDIEAEFGPALVGLAMAPEDGVGDVHKLLQFIFAQMTMTPGPFRNSLDYVNSHLENVFAAVKDINCLSDADCEGFTIPLEDPRSILGAQLAASQFFWPSMLDLKCIVLINKSETPFVISDNPVVMYNWLFRDVCDQPVAMISAIGINVLLPISPVVTVFFYDAAVYKISGCQDGYFYVYEDADVNVINELQVRNRSTSIVFKDESSFVYVKELCDKFECRSLNELVYSNSTVVIKDQDYISSSCFPRQTRLSNWLSFVALKEDVDGVTLGERVPEAMEYLRKSFLDEIEGK